MQETLTKLKELQVLAVDLRYETEEKEFNIHRTKCHQPDPASKAFKEHHFEK